MDELGECCCWQTDILGWRDGKENEDPGAGSAEASMKRFEALVGVGAEDVRCVGEGDFVDAKRRVVELHE